MLTERQINGGNCLTYVIGETEALQSFHLGMLTTNRQLPALPVQCQYVDGVETLIMPLHDMIPVKGIIESQRGPDLAHLLMLLGKSIESLMAYQLKPENIYLDERCIYMDPSFKTIYLPYIPLKRDVNEPKTALSDLLLKWMDAGMNTQGAFTHPLFIQLLLKLRQEHCSFRMLVDVLTKSEDQPYAIYSKQNPACSEAHEPVKPAMSLKDMKKLDKTKPSARKSHLNMQLIIQNKKLLGYSPIGLAIAASGIMTLIAPMSPSSKLGVAMILVASSVYISQKLMLYLSKNALAPKKASEVEKARIEPTTLVGNEKGIPSPFSLYNQPSTMDIKVNPHLSASEETVLLSASQAKAVLMVRDSEGPRYFKMQKDQVTIGRNPSVCDLVLDETGIGRMHAEIHHNQGQYYIKDNQSLNGTFVNGKRITSNQYFQLNTGDLIQIAHKEVVFS